MVEASAVGSDGRAAVAGALAPFSGQIFTIPAAGTIGTLQQRIFTGPWDTNFDFGLSKSTRIKERHEILLRMDSTNFLNHPAFSIGDQTVTSTTFGKITSTFNSRRAIQFKLQYRFSDSGQASGPAVALYLNRLPKKDFAERLGSCGCAASPRNSPSVRNHRRGWLCHGTGYPAPACARGPTESVAGTTRRLSFASNGRPPTQIIEKVDQYCNVVRGLLLS
jgi:hypothetical protein